MADSRLPESNTRHTSCLVAEVVLPPRPAQRLCDRAGLLACWLPHRLPLVEAALAYLLTGGTIRRRQRCRCRRTLCLHDIARLLLGSTKAGP